MGDLIGHKNKESLTRQIEKEYTSMLAIGESKHEAKQTKDGISNKIYSFNTLRTYMKHANYFTNYCKEKYHCKTLEDCKPHINEWLETRQNLSSYTVKMEAAALAKLYHCSTTDFNVTQSREREDITRSRQAVGNDAHFNERIEKNREFAEFCRSTGLRRNEITKLTGDKLIYKKGKPYIIVDKGTKGGKYREAPVIGTPEQVQNVERIMKEAGENKVFEKIPSHADVHSFRSDYATTYYNQIARDIKDIPYDKVNKGTGRKYQSEVYHCKNEKKGIAYDKKAMLEVSRALGHNRISVIGGHYLR